MKQFTASELRSSLKNGDWVEFRQVIYEVELTERGLHLLHFHQGRPYLIGWENTEKCLSPVDITPKEVA